MKCYANRVGNSLLNIPPAGPAVASFDGPGARILPDQADRLNDSVQEFKFLTRLNVSGGSGQPSAQLVISGSLDGVSWFDLAAGTAQTAPGSYTEVIDSNTVGLLPWIRGRLVLAGTTPPSCFCSIDIVSTGPFQLSSAK